MTTEIKYSLDYDNLKVEWSGEEFGEDEGIGVYVSGEEVYRASVVSDPRQETQDLFDAMQKVYMAGFAAA